MTPVRRAQCSFMRIAEARPASVLPYRQFLVEKVMTQDRRMSDFGASGVPIGAETIADYRARIAHQQAEAARRRQEELEEQSSTLKTPDTRIRIWERLHEVGLPRDPAHRLVGIIAANTGLTVEEVRDEQRLRASGAPAVAAPTE
jgi:hypothetical protein